jgi:3-oxoacyl-[acyl-carrier-protein] synthase-3
MNTIFNGCQVKGIAAAVPKQIVNNLTSHINLSEAEVLKTIELTGVKQYRRSAADICASDLCFEAAIHLMKILDVSPESIDAILFVTQTPDYRMPSTACLLQSRLGCRQSILTFDINLGCSGFIVGLFNCCALLSGAKFRRILLLCGDTQTKLAYENDKNVNFIMGDAGTATLIESTQDTEPICMSLNTDGSRYDKLIVPAGGFRLPSSEATRQIMKQPDGQKRSLEHIHMSGMDVFNFSVTDVVKTMKTFMEQNNISANILDFLILHQANKFMTDKIGRKLTFKPNQILYSLDIYGNTSCASIPLTIVHNSIQFQNKTVHCLLSGFGIGLSWGVADVYFKNLKCTEIIEV